MSQPHGAAAGGSGGGGGGEAGMMVRRIEAWRGGSRPTFRSAKASGTFWERTSGQLPRRSRRHPALPTRAYHGLSHHGRKELVSIESKNLPLAVLADPSARRALAPVMSLLGPAGGPRHGAPHSGLEDHCWRHVSNSTLN